MYRSALIPLLGFKAENPNGVPVTLNFAGANLFDGPRLRSEGSATEEARGPNRHGPHCQIPWPCHAGPTRSPFVAPMMSIFIPMDSS
jgi:hypothetical protein